MAWNYTAKWLDIRLDNSRITNLESAFREIAKRGHQFGGGICLTAMFWTIWKTRNELLFNNHKLQDAKIEYLIKFQAFGWGIANKLVNQQQIQPWFCNPIQVFKTNTRLAKRRLIAYWSEFSDIVGFIDGAWKKDSVGNITASIGGFLMESKLSLIFIFSGTTEASSPYEAELAALKFVLEQLGSSNFKEYSTTIFSDSKQLAHHMDHGINLSAADPPLGDVD